MTLARDQQARTDALDVAQSFIVQAPAGSGKTELLTDRFLALLTRCQAPEEIIAITFTRDAAAEMRARIIDKLRWAETQTTTTDALPSHQQITLQLARQVLQRDQQLNWQLLAQPARLRVLTIDALCASLTRQMPYLSRLGGQADVLDNPALLYEQAARLTLQCLEDPTYEAAISTLMRQCDNNADSAVRLLVDMLQKRDQWLSMVVSWPTDGADYFAQSVQQVVHDELQSLCRHIPLAQQYALMALAAKALQHAEPDSYLQALHDWQTALTPATPRAIWSALRQWLLTGDGDVRKQITKAQGFPPDAKKEKAEFQALLQELAQEAWPTFLTRIDQLPHSEHAAAQWQDVADLFTALKIAAAQLRQLFIEHGQVDFIEIAQAALQALGDHEQPTDLALALDYRVQHLLVDEFQDTSRTQWQLLQKLLAGWQHGDGRTLFLVGDPMQSIYRFRKAEVALFMRAQQHGISADVPLTPLTLTRNFRSQAAMVQWLNNTFAHVLPAQADAVYSAVPYVAADATKPALTGDAVNCHLWVRDSAEQNSSRYEAEQVVTLTQQALQQSDGEIAILVRARSHLRDIIPALQRANIAFTAVEIASLSDSPLISDLQQLTRALWHLGDRLAWLTVLRAPWCGLTAQSLHQLCARDHHLTVYEQLQRADFSLLTPTERQRIERVWLVLQNAIAQQDTLPLAARVEACWRTLHGPFVLQNDNERADVEQFFRRLYAFDFSQGDVIAQINDLSRDLYAQTDNHARVKLMTMHKSKGLEFDTVIVPGLEKKSASDSHSLLAWEDAIDDNREHLLIGPYEHRADVGTGMAAFLRLRDRVRAEEEAKRLLYVTATRAKNRLIWIGTATRNKKGEIKPGTGSLLHLLWPALSEQFLQNQHNVPAAETATMQVTTVPLTRLAQHWQPPLISPFSDTDVATSSQHMAVTRAGIRVRAIGIVTHAWLEHLANLPLPADADAFVQAIQPRVMKQLVWQGVNREDANSDAEHVLMALRNSLKDDKARWILQQHSDAHSEWALTHAEENGFSQHIIDRSFVDHEGTRWIIDYKTAIDDGGDWPQFLARKIDEYTPQLKRYAALLAQIESRPQKLALYFPLQQVFVEII